ncbi:Disks large -like protein 5, partial [Trichinella murrelli]
LKFHAQIFCTRSLIKNFCFPMEVGCPVLKSSCDKFVPKFNDCNHFLFCGEFYYSPAAAAAKLFCCLTSLGFFAVMHHLFACRTFFMTELGAGDVDVAVGEESCSGAVCHSSTAASEESQDCIWTLSEQPNDSTNELLGTGIDAGSGMLADADSKPELKRKTGDAEEANLNLEITRQAETRSTATVLVKRELSPCALMASVQEQEEEELEEEEEEEEGDDDDDVVEEPAESATPYQQIQHSGGRLAPFGQFGRSHELPPSLCMPWLSWSPVGRDRHASSSSYTHGDTIPKMRSSACVGMGGGLSSGAGLAGVTVGGGSASGSLGQRDLDMSVGQLATVVANVQNKRWSVAGAGPELTLLRVKLDDVQRELCELQSKHELMTLEYQDVLNELDCCRASKGRLEMELHDCRLEAVKSKGDVELLVQQKQLAERQAMEFQLKLQARQAELDDLRRQHAEIDNKDHRHYHHHQRRRDHEQQQQQQQQQQQHLQKHEQLIASTLMMEYEQACAEVAGLKDRCRLLEAETVELGSALRLAQDECRHIRAGRERDLEQHRLKISSFEECQVSLYQQLHKIAQQRDILRSENDMLKQQLQDLCGDMTSCCCIIVRPMASFVDEEHWQENLNVRQKHEEAMRVLRRQHDGVLSEYRHVMSERDSVLKENERLSEEKGNLLKKVKSSESDRHALIEQLKTVEAQIEAVRQERDALQQQLKARDEQLRDRLLAVASAYATASGRQMRQVDAVDNGMNPYMDPDQSITSEESVSELTSTTNATTTPNSAVGRCADADYDKLRRLADGLDEELTLVRQEVEAAKQQRDWALGERQRIVSERESMRSMCDNLRKERDDAITRLAVAIRDSDEIMRQKDQAEREIRKIKEKIEMDERRVTNVESTPSNSHDSAIDADMAEWEVETLELNMNGAQKNEDLGLELRGGRDDPVFGQLVPIYVTSVAVGSRLDGVLRTYDCIMMVNNIDVSLMERRSVMDILRNSSAVKMVIKRRRLVGMKLISVPLAAASDGDVGIVFEDGVYVSKIKTSSAAAKAGHLAVGDRLVYINDVPVENRSASTVEELVRSFNGCGLVLAVVKSPPVMSPITPSSSTFPFQTSLHSSSSAQMKHQDSCANCQSTAAAAAAVVVTKQKRDFAVQVSFVVTETHAPVKKYESLFDKMHDKIFGRSERKATVRAAAAVPIDTTDTPNESSKRWHNGQTCDRRARPSSVYSCYTVVDRSNSKGGVTAEQQVLQQLDSILEASERECDNKNKNNNNNNNNKALLLGVMNSERSGGGTWPKYKPNVNGSGVEMANVANGTVEPSPPQALTLAPAPAPAPDKFAGRRSALQAFHGKIVDKQSAVESRLRNTFAKRSSKIRSTEARPVSYHPTSVISGQYSLTGSKFSARPMSPLVGGNIHSTSSSSPSDDSPPQCLSLDSPAASSPLHHAAAGHKNLAYYGNHLNQGNHGRPGSLMMFKPNLQLHVAHAMPVVANTTNNNNNNNNRYSPCLAFDHQSPMASHIHDQDVDQRSYASQSSGSRGAAAVAGLFGSAAGDHQQCSSKSLHRLDAGRYHAAIHSLSRTKRVSNKLERVIPLHSFSSDEYNNQSGGGRLIKGDVRTLHIEKRSSHEGLGISVASSGNGVFVSSVSENSLAARHGLQVGDQLLEVCGINMRSANFQHASNVLSHLGRSEQITLMVQYNPNKYTREMTDYHSVCSTPRATPSSMLSTQGSKAFMSQDSSLQSTSATQSHELLTGSHCSVHYEPRFVFLKRDSDDWGFTLIGGNAIGIFVDDVKPAVACVVGPDTLRTGDQILEFDGVNFRKLTLEQALMEIGQRSVGSEVSVLVQYNDSRYQKCKRGAGDSFYVRVTVDRQAENTDELSFRSGDILRVDNTVFNGVAGLWRAWLVDQEGRERSCGIIPSKNRLEEEFLFKRSGSEISTVEGTSTEGGGGSRRGTIRRSLKFIRRSSRSSHQRTPSKESRDLESDSTIIDELYQRVERLDYKQKRPLLLLGTLVDVIVAKLLEDYPKMFVQCVPGKCVKPMPVPALEQGLLQNLYVDYRKRDKLFEITRVAVVKDLIDKGYHCILHVNPLAIERLHRLQIYPVVIFVKFKNFKQIKELCDDRLSSKQAKEMFENAAKVEAECHHLFSATIHGPHHSIKHICQQIACTVEHEQKKTLWIISGDTM